MKNKEKEILKKCFEDVVWMAIRYADTRHTYAPSMVRDAVNKFKEIFPDWNPQFDITIKPPKEEDLGGYKFKEDYLYDLFKDSNY